MSDSKTNRMPVINVEHLSDALRGAARQVLADKGRVKVKQDRDNYFVVLSAAEWRSEQETMHVLQDTDLVRQIAAASKSHARAASKG